MTTDRERLRISESATMVGVAEGEQASEPGTVLLHLMRPCLGKGQGRHIYEADMLQRHAESGHFDDWPMYVDHESPAAKKKAEGLPRSLRDVGGRIVRTWWDPTVEASSDFGKGAVVAEAKPTPWVHELIEHDPKLANVSLNTYATGVRPKKVGGRPAYVVEGFVDEGSADWVTKPGAGGRVVQLLEAEIQDVGGSESDLEPEHEMVLEALSDEDLESHIRNHRPRVAESLINKPVAGEEDEMDSVEIQEAALESLQSDAGKAVIVEIVQEAAKDAMRTTLKEVLPDAIAAAATTIEENARVAASNQVRMGKLSDRAAEKIEEAKLPSKFEAVMKRKFADVDLQDKTDAESGEVTETAEQQLDALVEAEIKEQIELIGSINPTIVSGNGNGGGTDEDNVTEGAEDGAHLSHELAEAGVNMEAAWGVKPQTEEPAEKPAEPATAAA